MESQSPMTKQEDVVAIELPAPEGWKKKFTPRKSGTPRRNEIVFISPTGEEIKSKRQLDQYIKSHPGGPSTSEFDWGTGDTPRRSARLSEKSKAVESPESETPKKKQRKSSTKKKTKGNKYDSDGGGETTEEKEGAAKEAKGSADVAMEDAEDAGDRDEGKDFTEEAPTDKGNVKDSEQKTNEGEGLKEEAVVNKDNVDEIEQKSVGKIGDTTMEEPENEETGNKTSDAKGERSETKSMPIPEVKENNKEAEKGADPKDSSQLHLPSKAASSDQGTEILKEPVPEVADGKAENNKEADKELDASAELPGPSVASSSEQEAENVKDAVPEVEDPKVEESKNAEVGQEDHQNNETPEKAANAEEAKPDNENQEVEKQLENHSASCDGSPRAQDISS